MKLNLLIQKRKFTWGETRCRGKVRIYLKWSQMRNHLFFSQHVLVRVFPSWPRGEPSRADAPHTQLILLLHFCWCEKRAPDPVSSPARAQSSKTSGVTHSVLKLAWQETQLRSLWETQRKPSTLFCDTKQLLVLTVHARDLIHLMLFDPDSKAWKSSQQFHSVQNI